MQTQKKINFKTILILISILILVVPDILINSNQNILNFCSSLISKICELAFIGLVLLRLTRSYFMAYLILGIPYLISSIVEIGNIIILDHYITVDNIGALSNASHSEINEFYQGFWIYLFIPIIVVATYIFMLKKYKSINYNSKNKRIIVPLAILFFSISISISFYKVLHSRIVYSDNNITNYTLKTSYLLQHPFNLYYRIYQFTKIRLRINKYKYQQDNFKFGILNPSDTTKPNLVIFIIGERMRYSNWSINGYNRATTPNLKKVTNLISFNKNYSNANNTYWSIPLIITQATPKTPNDAYSQKSIVSLFKEAGYETSWISSQYLFDIIDEKREPDHLYELYKNKHTDLDIIPLYDSVLNKKTSKNKFIIINMLGGHGEVPAQFNVFKPNNNLKNYPITMQNAPIFINDYDNIVLLQDYVLSEIMKMTEKQNVSSVLLFTADHGCNLFDNGRALFGYGSANPTEKETHVPMFVNMSKKYIENNHNKYNNLINHKNLLTTNNNIFYTLSDLANIKYKSFKPTQSISDSFFVEPPSRFVYIHDEVREYKK